MLDFACRWIEDQLCHRIGEDADALSFFQANAGATIAVHVTDWRLLCLAVCNHRGLSLTVQQPTDASYQVSVEGTLKDLLALLSQDAALPGLFHSALLIRGDSQLLQACYQQFQRLSLDEAWWCSAIFGRTAGPLIAQGSRCLKGVARDLLHGGLAGLTECAQYEHNQLAVAAQVADWCADVALCAEALDRLQARIDCLEQRRDAP